MNEQECLAIQWALKRYRSYLEDEEFTLRTDNKALLWLNTAKNSNAKLTRWALLLQEFKFKVEHCPGKLNQLPDPNGRGNRTSHGPPSLQWVCTRRPRQLPKPVRRTARALPPGHLEGRHRLQAPG